MIHVLETVQRCEDVLPYSILRGLANDHESKESAGNRA